MLSHDPVIIQFGAREQEVMALRKLCREWSHNKSFWPFDDVLQFNSRRDSRIFYTPSAEDSTVWDGVILVKVGIEAADLIYVYISPEKRRSGLGECLMRHVIEYLRGAHPGLPLMLEVRISNTAAKALYEKVGMQPLNVRKHYYSDGEGAQVYSIKL